MRLGQPTQAAGAPTCERWPGSRCGRTIRWASGRPGRSCQSAEP
jgi:hypothetical protein